MAAKKQVPASTKTRAAKAAAKVIEAKKATAESKKKQKNIVGTADTIRKQYWAAPKENRKKYFNEYADQQIALTKMWAKEKNKQGAMRQSTSERERTATRATGIAKRVAKKGK